MHSYTICDCERTNNNNNSNNVHSKRIFCKRIFLFLITSYKPVQFTHVCLFSISSERLRIRRKKEKEEQKKEIATKARIILYTPCAFLTNNTYTKKEKKRKLKPNKIENIAYTHNNTHLYTLYKLIILLIYMYIYNNIHCTFYTSSEYLEYVSLSYLYENNYLRCLTL